MKNAWMAVLVCAMLLIGGAAIADEDLTSSSMGPEDHEFVAFGSGSWTSIYLEIDLSDVDPFASGNDTFQNIVTLNNSVAFSLELDLTDTRDLHTDERDDGGEAGYTFGRIDHRWNGHNGSGTCDMYSLLSEE